MTEFRSDHRTKPVPARRVSRLFRSVLKQRSRSLSCPDTPRLDGQKVLVTGGSEGIGLGTCRGLMQRGADVVIAARSSDKGIAAAARLSEEFDRDVIFMRLDLSDLDSVVEFCRSLHTELGDARLDGLICNAGVMPRRHRTSAQGHELAFATNVLGHYLLLRHLVDRLLSEAARVVVVTGDIYILASDCTPDFRFRTPLGGTLAYCRSKLGNLWIARELQRRHQKLRVRVVHPGVVATGLGGSRSGLADTISRRFMLDPDRGAQATLYCATQDGIPAGAYIHNVLGLMQLSSADPASDNARAEQLWDQCEQLCAEKLPPSRY